MTGYGWTMTSLADAGVDGDAPSDDASGTSRPLAGIIRVVTPALLTALAYYLGARIGFALQSPRAPQSILWLPNSIVLAVLLARPPRQWATYLLAALPAQLLVGYQFGVPLGAMSLLYVTNCADAMLGAAIVRHVTRSRIDFGTLRTMLAFIAGAATLSPFLLSFADAGITVLSGWGSDYWLAFSTRVSSNVLTHLVVVPVLASALLATSADWRKLSAARSAEAAAVLAGLLLTAGVGLGRLLTPGEGSLLTLAAPAVLPFLLWLAVRFGPATTGLGLLLVSFVASWQVLHAPGVATAAWLDETIDGLQLFLTATAIPLLCLAAVMRERAAAAVTLHRTTEEMRVLASRVSLAQEAERIRLAKLDEGSRQVAHMGRISAAGELAAALSHELRQPLSAIRSNAQAGVRFLSSESPPLGEVKAILEDIVADDSRASSVIERIRALLRNEEPRREALDLNEVCRVVRMLVRSAAVLHGTRLEVELDPTIPRIVGDSVLLQQVVLNLALNALEASAASDGERAVWITTRRHGDIVELTVRDSGRGLAPEVAPHLFQPFFSTKAQGLGMGLAIVRSIVERHRGSIRAENVAQGGAVFAVTLPASDRAGVAAPPAAADQPVRAPDSVRA